MSRYYVTWAMDIEDVETPLEAALACREIMLDPETTAVVFSVKNNETNETTEVDLWGHTVRKEVLCRALLSGLALPKQHTGS